MRYAVRGRFLSTRIDAVVLRHRFSLLACLATLFVGFVYAGDRAQDEAFFENKVRPVLVEHCYSCHSADAQELGGKLLLDSLEGMKRGGESGPAVVPGQHEASLLLQAVRYDGIEMPPDAPLPETVINDLEAWVKAGAFYPVSKVQPAPAAEADPAEPPVELWSLQPITDPEPPAVQNTGWAKDPIDQFVLARIQSAGLQPTGDAPPQVLIRRLYFDLIGLPPSRDEVGYFVDAYRQNKADAVRSLVDDLLSRSQFGERWGRYWLDVARYAESNGNDGLGRNPTFPHAWRYRDYVIDSFNNDTPFNLFITEQVAGDVMPYESPEEHDRQRIATGFLAMSAKPAKAMNNDFAMDVVSDQIDVVTRGFMGLSVACARCHDHKFDPVPTRDYYAMAGFFTSTETMWGVAANEGLTAPPTDLYVLKAAPVVEPPKDFVETAILKESDTGKPKKIPPSKWKPGTPLAMGVRASRPIDCQINVKGDSKKLGDAVPRGFVSAIPCNIDDSGPVDSGPLGRLHLAQWLTSPENPLTARVYVNRVWQHLFGKGLVASPDDFGVYGDRPSHPELLDHLASRFVANGWSTKRLIRNIVLSRTYQLDSSASNDAAEADPENQWLARHTRRRLDAEALRDTMLHASGRLDLSPGEGSLVRHRDILVNIAGNIHEPSNKRSVYLCYLRNSPPPELSAFNLPEFLTLVGKRDTSTIPAQALHLFNSEFVRSEAAALAMLIMQQADNSSDRVKLLFHRTLARDAVESEVAAAEDLLQSLSKETDEQQAWTALCQAMLATNEFRYID